MRISLLALSLIIAALAVACGQSQPGPTAIEWIDGTGSAKADSIPMCTRRARAVTEQIANKHGRALVERLDTSTANAPTFQVAKQFDVPAEIASDPRAIARKRRADVDALYRAAAPELAAPAAGSTELVGALAASAAKLQNYTGTRFIYVCSDLLDRRLLKLGEIDQRNVNRLLARMRALGEIPAMHGARVVLDTTSAVARDDLGPREQAAIELFYRTLVKRGGGDVVAYGTGADLPLG
jgi:hypothetical protein